MCRARAVIKIENEDQSFSGLSRIEFIHNDKESEIELRIVNPLGLTEAKIYVDSDERIFSRAGSEFDLRTRPELDKWLSNKWWSELGFVFDIVDASAAKRSFIDTTGSATQYRGLTRRIECENRDSTTQQATRRCSISDDEMEATINLTFFKCKKSLS